MLRLHRRHLGSCPHRHLGWNYTLCACPIWADGKLNGQRFKRSLGTDNWDRAVRRLQMLERDGDLVSPQGPDSPPLPAAVEAFLEACRLRDLKSSSLRSYQTALGYLTNELGKIELSRINTPMLDRYRAGRRIAAGTWHKELQVFRSFFNWCRARKWIAENPAHQLRMPQIAELVTLPLELGEISSLIAATDEIFSDNPEETPYIRKRARALVYTLLYSGLRISDVTRLRRAALVDNHLVLKVLKTGVPLKVLLHQDAVKALFALPAVSTEYFFWSGRGDPDSCTGSLGRTMQRLGAIAKVKAHPHRFRDTFAVELLTNGVDIRTVQLLLGHKSVRTTERHYAHFVAAHQALLDSAVSTLSFEPKPARPLLMKPRHNRRRNP